MSKTKGGGSTRNGRDSNAQRLGVKVYGGQPVTNGGIIVRQVGNTVRSFCFGAMAVAHVPNYCCGDVGHAKLPTLFCST